MNYSLKMFEKDMAHVYAVPQEFVNGYIYNGEEPIQLFTEGAKFVLANKFVMEGENTKEIADRRFALADNFFKKYPNKGDYAGYQWIGLGPWIQEEDGTFSQETSFVAFEKI